MRGAEPKPFRIAAAFIPAWFPVAARSRASRALSSSDASPGLAAFLDRHCGDHERDNRVSPPPAEQARV
jgi:hypothetical protein